MLAGVLKGSEGECSYCMFIYSTCMWIRILYNGSIVQKTSVP